LPLHKKAADYGANTAKRQPTSQRRAETGHLGAAKLQVESLGAPAAGLDDKRQRDIGWAMSPERSS
jgi:hypothetical protein